MYLEFFGLTAPPFRITPDTGYWFEGGQRGDLLATLEYAVTHGDGLIKVTGEVGSGKTMLCRMLQQCLPDNVDSVYLGNPTLDPDGILAAILADLGVTPSASASRQSLLDQLNGALLSRHSHGRHVVIFVEEAQGMSVETLEFLRLLTNLETARDKLLQIILFGQPELDQTLADPKIRQFKDRITLGLKLAPLSESETAAYLRRRLQVAGYRGPDLFPAAVVREIARLSGGLSRRINILADKALLAAFGESTHNLTPAHIQAAARDAEILPATPAKKPGLRQWGWAMAGVTAGLSLLVYFSWIALGQQAVPQHHPAAATMPAAPHPPAINAGQTTDMRHVVESADWVRNAPAGTFVIQVLAAKNTAEANEKLKGIYSQLPRPLRGFHARTPQGPAWIVVAGEFPDRQTALAALSALPIELRSAGYFLRTAGKIRTTLIPEGKPA